MQPAVHLVRECVCKPLSEERLSQTEYLESTWTPEPRDSRGCDPVRGFIAKSVGNPRFLAVQPSHLPSIRALGTNSQEYDYVSREYRPHCGSLPAASSSSQASISGQSMAQVPKSAMCK